MSDAPLTARAEADSTTALWRYRCRITRIIDGDTVVGYIDQGFNAFREERLRLVGINAPEVYGENAAAGTAATAFTRAWLAEANVGDWPFVVRTEKTDSFGRYLADIRRADTGASLSEALLASGHAVPWSPRRQAGTLGGGGDPLDD